METDLRLNRMKESCETEPVFGRVKWFDPVKGFGFVVVDEDGPDILLHANVLRNFGQGSVADGAGILLKVQETQRGVQALEVLRIDPPADVAETTISDLDETDIDTDALALVPARVKWFDKTKGFGFANVFGNPEDIFIHVEVLRRSGFSDLQPGEAIAIRIVDGQRGRMAQSIVSWDNEG